MPILSPEVLDFQKDILPLRGNLRFPLTHDYMFIRSFTRNTYALKGFLAAKLRVKPEEITGLEIRNPLQPGAHMDDKDIVLDIEVCLNGERLIDIEMQLTHYDYLPERFLYQLCRIYSNALPKGEDYGALPPVIHIAIMDCDLFPKGDRRNTQDFLSEYYLMNPKNRTIYTGNFHLEVVSLKHMENAEDKDDPNGLYRWAKLFKATTWREYNMVAQNNDYMESIATSVCALCHDPKFVRECERRLRNEWEYNSRMAEADRKGREQGIEQGLKQGLQQGIEQGISQGIQALILDNLEEGRGRDAILDKLVRRFALSRGDAEKYYAQHAPR